MPYDGSAWNETTPTNATISNEIDDVERDTKIAVRSRMVVEHLWPSSQAATNEAGLHRYITLAAQTAMPGLVVGTNTQVGALYCSTAAGNPLMYVYTSGSAMMIVASGGILNNTFGTITVGTSFVSNMIINSVSTGSVTATNQGALYIKSTGTQSELFFREELSGDEVQLTTLGDVKQHILGTYTTGLSGGVNYTAATDGFAIGNLKPNGNLATAKGYTDNTATPSQIVAECGSGPDQTSQSIIFPVKKGYKWRIDFTVESGSTVNWIPLA